MTSSRRATARKMAGLLRPYPVRSVLAFVLGIGIVGFTTRQPVVLGQAVDDVVGHRSGAAAGGALLYLALSLSRFACASSRRYIGGSLGADIERDLRNRIAAHVLKLDAAWHDRAGTGELLARANSDVEAIRNFLSFGVVFSVLNTLTVMIAVIQMLLLSASLALVTLAFAPLLVVLTVRYNGRTHRVSRRIQDRIGALTTVVEESAAGIQVVKALGAEEARHAAFTGQSTRLLAENLSATRLRVAYGPLFSLLPQLSLVVVLWYGSRLVARHDISLGTLVAVVSYLEMIIFPLQSVSRLSGMGQRAMASAARIFEVLEVRPAITDLADAVCLPDPPGPGAARGARVSIEAVTFRYPGAGSPALDEFSLDVASGERVAVIGASGTGKSSLAALLCRGYDPCGGRILLDGRQTTTITLQSLRAAVVVVPAEPILFAAPLRDNLTLGAPWADDDAIKSALWAADALDFTQAMPGGLGAVLGERGTTLSGGQRQRVALARAVLAHPRLLILDDALSQLDALTEATVLERLAVALDGVTVIALAGHSTNGWFYDRVLTLTRGRP
jgi:ABC-type multidrug transport system fused ATPase/permease subunit